LYAFTDPQVFLILKKQTALKVSSKGF